MEIEGKLGRRESWIYTFQRDPSMSCGNHSEARKQQKASGQREKEEIFSGNCAFRKPVQEVLMDATYDRRLQINLISFVHFLFFFFFFSRILFLMKPSLNTPVIFSINTNLSEYGSMMVLCASYCNNYCLCLCVRWEPLSCVSLPFFA